MESESTEQERTSITFRLSSEKKQKWIEYLNSDSPHSTLTGLIKTSVDNRIGSRWVLVNDYDDSEAANIPDDLDQSLESITERLTTIETRLDEQEIAGTPDNVNDELEDQEIRNLAMQAHNYLPIVADADHVKSLTEYDSPTLDPHKRASITGTAQDIFSVLDAPEDNIRTALIISKDKKARQLNQLSTMEPDAGMKLTQEWIGGRCRQSKSESRQTLMSMT